MQTNAICERDSGERERKNEIIRLINGFTFGHFFRSNNSSQTQYNLLRTFSFDHLKPDFNWRAQKNADIVNLDFFKHPGLGWLGLAFDLELIEWCKPILQLPVNNPCSFLSSLAVKRGKKWKLNTTTMEPSASTSEKHSSSTRNCLMDLRTMSLSCPISPCWAPPHRANMLLGKWMWLSSILFVRF